MLLCKKSSKIFVLIRSLLKASFGFAIRSVIELQNENKNDNSNITQIALKSDFSIAFKSNFGRSSVIAEEENATMVKRNLIGKYHLSSLILYESTLKYLFNTSIAPVSTNKPIL